jgi:hypothetical protein
LQHGAKGHWLGHSNAKYVMVYFHGKAIPVVALKELAKTYSGGGYIAPATKGHLKYQFALQNYLREQGIDISVLSISYILAPQVLHPLFIQQGLSALQYLIEKTNRDPSTILIAGDSAGGNLVASLLLHLGVPHPNCTQYTLKKKLKGAVMISPWVSFDTNSPSIQKNKYSDYITKSALEYGSTTFIGPNADHDAYSQPADAPVQWWKEVAEKVVENVLIWGGGGELLIDGIKKFSINLMTGFEDAEDVVEEKNKLLKMMTVDVEKLHPEVHLRAKLVVSPHEAHVEMIINYLLYIKKEEDGGRQIKKWLVDVLTRHDEATEKEPSAETVKEEVTEKKEGIIDTEKSIEKAEESQEKRELVEEEKRQAAEAVVPVA